MNGISYVGKLHTADRFRSQPPACPGVLKIEPAGNTVYVHHFPREKNARYDPALHGIGIDLG